ncbi:MAG TPA: hypothetical protein PKW90_07410 [Myxococcota bacterium]|nr:hypothetical protein [Myxococcota bacterium]
MRCFRITAGPFDYFEGGDFSGPMIRAALGLSCRLLGCMRDCGAQDACEREECPWVQAFHRNDNRAVYRIDSSDLDGRRLSPRDRWELRLVAFEKEALLLRSAELALGRGLGADRIPQRIYRIEEEEVDPQQRSAAWGEWVEVQLRSPSDLRRAQRRIENPGPSDLLHSIRHRVRDQGLDPGLPPFEQEVEGEKLWQRPYKGAVWQQEREQNIPIEGLRGAWRLRPTPAQRAWLALGELVGVGRWGSRGMGVLRIQP